MMVRLFLQKPDIIQHKFETKQHVPRVIEKNVTDN